MPWCLETYEWASIWAESKFSIPISPLPPLDSPYNFSFVLPTFIIISTMNSFDSYSTPLKLSAYSAQYFHSLTFREALGLHYPTIAPASSVIAWVFVEDIPTQANTQHMMPDDVAPDISEVLHIIPEACASYKLGKRVVYIHMYSNGKETNYLYHFSKVQKL